MNQGVMFMIAIVTTVLVIVMIKGGTEVYVGTVTDIESVSVGGFMRETACIIYIDGQKVNERGGLCYLQIGDRICNLEYFIFNQTGECGRWRFR